MIVAMNPCERLRDVGWNIPKITQPYTRQILVHIFYCAVQVGRYFRSQVGACYCDWKGVPGSNLGSGTFSFLAWWIGTRLNTLCNYANCMANWKKAIKLTVNENFWLLSTDDILTYLGFLSGSFLWPFFLGSPNRGCVSEPRLLSHQFPVFWHSRKLEIQSFITFSIFASKKFHKKIRLIRPRNNCFSGFQKDKVDRKSRKFEILYMMPFSNVIKLSML